MTHTHSLSHTQTDGNGYIDRGEYLRIALVHALAQSHGRVLDLLNEMDTDGNKQVGKAEFRKAVRSLGFSADAKTCEKVRV